MASSLSRLAAHVADGSIKIVELQAVPRSLSTALGRCLNESGATSVFVNELFNMDNGDPDVAAGYVMQAVEPELSSAAVIVVTKNMARFLTAAVFDVWSQLCSAVVWCIRDPRAQISSLVTRTANDLFCGVGSDRLAPADLRPVHLEAVTEFLRHSEQSTDFSKTGWRAIGTHFADCAPHLPSFVADGSLLIRNPELFLRDLCGQLGLDFRDRMVDGWQKPYFNVSRLYHPELDDVTDAWIKQAATSRGVERTENRPLEESVLPAPLRDHLVNEALPVYQMLTAAAQHPHRPARRIGRD